MIITTTTTTTTKIIITIIIILPLIFQGFKNRLASVQIAAYKAWNVLIDDFALDTGNIIIIIISVCVIDERFV